jgi:hypothetical protein
VTQELGHVGRNVGHVAGIPPVTFAGIPVTIPESAVTLDRNTQ